MDSWLGARLLGATPDRLAALWVALGLDLFGLSVDTVAKLHQRARGM